jgi:hypothetical protein
LAALYAVTTPTRPSTTRCSMRVANTGSLAKLRAMLKRRLKDDVPRACGEPNSAGR